MDQHFLIKCPGKSNEKKIPHKNSKYTTSIFLAGNFPRRSVNSIFTPDLLIHYTWTQLKIMFHKAYLCNIKYIYTFSLPPLFTQVSPEMLEVFMVVLLSTFFPTPTHYFFASRLLSKKKLPTVISDDGGWEWCWLVSKKENKCYILVSPEDKKIYTQLFPTFSTWESQEVLRKKF